eukprot:4260662-Prymnesium_polylepis.1
MASTPADSAGLGGGELWKQSVLRRGAGCFAVFTASHVACTPRHPTQRKRMPIEEEEEAAERSLSVRTEFFFFFFLCPYVWKKKKKKKRLSPIRARRMP